MACWCCAPPASPRWALLPFQGKRLQADCRLGCWFVCRPGPQLNKRAALPPAAVLCILIPASSWQLPPLPRLLPPLAQQACVKKDERALRTFVQRYIQLPLPDYSGRLALLGAFAQVGVGSCWGRAVQCGACTAVTRTDRKQSAGRVLVLVLSTSDPHASSPSLALFVQREGLDASAHLSLLAQLTEGLSAGQLLAFVQQLAQHMRGSGPAEGAAGQPAERPAAAALFQQQQQQQEPLVQAALELLPGFPPVKPEDAQALREWTARAHSPLPPEVRDALCCGSSMLRPHDILAAAMLLCVCCAVVVRVAVSSQLTRNFTSMHIGAWHQINQASTAVPSVQEEPKEGKKGGKGKKK